MSNIKREELERYHRSGCDKYETLRGIYPNDKRLTDKPCSCGFDELIDQYSQGKVDEAHKAGHWWTHGKRLDAYGNTAHYCNCGYRASRAEAVKGHVEWKKAEMQAQLADIKEKQ